MKSPFHFSRPVLLPSLLATTLLLAACGQKGPLYLGKPPPLRVKTQPATNVDASGAANATDNAQTGTVDVPSLQGGDISLPAVKSTQQPAK